MGFSRQEYWSGLPCPLPGNLSDPGVEPGSPALKAGSLPSEPPENPISHPTLVSILVPHRITEGGLREEQRKDTG